MTIHALGTPSREPLLVCLSHLRWNFVYQRPQHLMARLSRRYRVLFIEEPVAAETDKPFMAEKEGVPGVRVLVPHLDAATLADPPRAHQAQRALLDQTLAREQRRPDVLWFYTPMALAFADHVRAPVVVYDCMDELSAFAGAPAEMGTREKLLMARADVMLTGGPSLYRAKRQLHKNVHCLPSSVDAAHFRRARRTRVAPADQQAIPGPRIGFAGVIDERMDLSLVAGVAALRPDWHLVLLGPVVKIDPGTLPQAPNIHYLGMKSYQDLPDYFGGWDAAIMPFARNAATRYISPTKTPEYLAGGCPVVSTSIPDVVAVYGAAGLAAIGDTPDEFVSGLEAALKMDRAALWNRADRFLDAGSWDHTAERVETLLASANRTGATFVEDRPRRAAAR